MDAAGLRSLFSACDLNRSGQLELSDLTSVCEELQVPEHLTRTLFEQLDRDHSGSVSYEDFCSRFQEVSEALDPHLSALCRGDGPSQAAPGEQFLGRIEGADSLSGSLQVELCSLHASVAVSNVSLQQFEVLIQSLVLEASQHKEHRELLEKHLRRTEEQVRGRVLALEEDFQEQLGAVELRTRQQESDKMEGVLASTRRKHQQEVTELRAAVEKLSQIQDQSKLQRSDVALLKQQISDLTLENEHLRGSLLKAQTDVSVLRSQLDSLKNLLTEQKLQHQRESEDLKRMLLEYQSYSTQIHALQETNQRLYDSNDGLRSALHSEVVATKRKLSPGSAVPARRMKPLGQSSLNHGSSAPGPGRTSYAHVARWANKYLDSGLSVSMETAESSDADSDDSRVSVETAHHSYSYVPSDVEISDVKSDAAISVTPSRASSIASSLRRRLSAFSTRPLEAGAQDPEGPMLRLVLAGDAGSGKSSFLLRLSLNQFRTDIQTTLGVDFQIKKMLVDGERTTLQIWDTAGQERFRSVARSYFRKAHGVLLLYDVTSESSFLNVRAWAEQIQDSTEQSVPMCLVGNKVDLREERAGQQCVSAVQGEKLAKAYGALFCETSAKEGTNVVEAVLHLAREVKKASGQRRPSESGVRLSPSGPRRRLDGCCAL